jgi:predicted  nucleic acid-binding Zn-ribbon protein
MFRSKAPSLLVVVLLLLCFSGQLRAQSEQRVDTAEPNNEPVRSFSLLYEVRQLRLALRQNSVQQHRSNLIVERIRHEQDLTEILEAQHGDLTDQIGDLTAEGRYGDEIAARKDYETEIAEASDAGERAQLIQEQSHLKRSLERERKTDGDRVERLRDRAHEIEKKLETERETLVSLRFQLDDMERELERQVANGERQRAARAQSQQL